MNTYIGLLRGINVGGRNKLPMRELRQLLENLGLRRVRTYIQSGNVVFESAKANREELAAGITDAVEQKHGFHPEILLVEPEELRRAMAENPYPEAEATPKTLHLTFLSSPPKNPDMESLEKLRQEDERYALQGKVFYLHAPKGIGKSKLAAHIEKAMGVRGTARNWRSVAAIMAMAEAEEVE